MGADNIDQDHGVDGLMTTGFEPVWSVWRQDENGHTFLITSGLTHSDAWDLVREYEHKGHKQLYWAQKIA